MHHPIDVIAGSLLGLASLWSCARRAGVDGVDGDRSERRRRGRCLERTPRRLDLTAIDRRSPDDHFHVHRRVRLAHGRRGRPTPSRARHRRPARLGRQGRRLRPARRARRSDRPRRDRAERPGTGEGRPARPARSPRSPTRRSAMLALWVIAIGLLLYVAWRLVSIVLPAENSAKAWLTRAGYLVSAVVYVALGMDGDVVRPAPAGGDRAETEDAKVERFTRDLMEMTGGRWLVGVDRRRRHRRRPATSSSRGYGRTSATSSSPAASVRSATRRSSRSAGSAGSVAAIVIGLVGWFADPCRRRVPARRGEGHRRRACAR